MCTNLNGLNFLKWSKWGVLTFGAHIMAAYFKGFLIVFDFLKDINLWLCVIISMQCLM